VIQLKTAHLFAGIGGGLLADLILGHDPVCAIEINPYCCQILRERVEDGWFPGLHVHEGDIRGFDWTPWKGRVDCISAGFPCQDISCAGRGDGIGGKRSGLVSEVWRAVDTVRPKFIFLENSPNIRTKGRREVIAELVARGYSWKDGRIAASDVGAPHKRERWFCIAANTDGMRQLEQERRKFEQWGWYSNSVEALADPACLGCGSRRAECQGQQGSVQFERCALQPSSHTDTIGRHGRARNESEADGGYEFEDGHNPAANDLCHRLQIAIWQGGLREAEAEAIQAAAGYTGAYHWSPPDIGVCGMVDGISPKMERIKGLGNAQVPLQAAAAWTMLMNEHCVRCAE